MILASLLVLWLLGLALLAGLAYGLANGWRPDLVEALLELSARELTQHELEIGGIEGSLLRGLVLREVSISSLAAPADPPLRAARVTLRLDLGRSLRQRRFFLPTLAIEGLELVLSRPEDSAVQIEGWGPLGVRPEPETTPSAPPLAIETLSIRESRIEYRRDEQARVGPLAATLNATLRGLAWRSREPLEWPLGGQLDLELHALALRGLDLGHGRISVGLRGGSANIERLELEGPFGRLAATGAITTTGPLERPRLGHVRAELQLEQLDIGGLREDRAADAERITSLNGQLGARLVRPRDASSSSPHLLLEASLGPSELFGEAISEAQLKGRYRIGDESWKLREADIVLPAGRLGARAHGTLRELGQLVLAAPDIELAKLPRSWLPLDVRGGRASIDVSLSGPYSDPVGSLSIRCADLRFESLGPGDLLLGLTAEGERRYRIDVFEATFGEDERTRTDRYLRSTRPAALQLLEGGVEVRDFELEWPGGALAVSGGLEHETLLPTRITLHSLDVGLAESLAGVDWQSAGEMSGDLRLEGPLAEPLVNAQILWRDARLGRVEADQVALAIEASGPDVQLLAEVIHADREQLRMLVRLPRDLDYRNPRSLLADERMRLELRATEFDLESISPLLEDRGLLVSGLIDGSVSGAGGAPFPRLDGALSVREGRVLEAAATQRGARLLLAGPLNGRLGFTGDSLQIVGMRAGRDASELSISGEISWSGPRAESIEFDVRLDGVGFKGEMELVGAITNDVLEPSVLSMSSFDAAELGRLAGLETPLGGQLWAELELSGEAADPMIEMKAAWEQPQIGSATADRLRVDAATQDDELLVYAHVERGGRMVLAVDGRLPLELDRSVGELLDSVSEWPRDPRSDLELRAQDVALDWLPVLAPRFPVKSRGSVAGSLRLQGGDPLPLVKGELALQAAVFTLAGQEAKAGPLDGVVRFEGRSARFEELVLSSSKGRATITGTLGWNIGGVTDVQLQLAFENYLFNQLGLLRTYLNGSLHATGPLEGMHVTGEIQLSDVRVSFPSRQDPVLKEIRVLGLPDSSKAASITEGEGEIAGLDERTSVDVSLVMVPGTWVRGMGLDAEIAGQVRVTKQPRQPLLYRGDFVVAHGRYTLQGKRFELERGVAVFVADQGAVPDVDIVATRNVSRDVRVTAHLTGRADDMNLELTSTPPMDTAEIISYVFFGGSQSGDLEQNTPQLQGTAASVAGMLLFDTIPPELREALRVDKIGVTSGDEGVPAVEIETQLTPDVYLRMIQSLGATGDEAVEVRWRFWKKLNLRSKVARSGSSSIDLIWAYDYWGLERFGLGGLRAPPPPYRAEAILPAEEEPLCRPPELCSE